MQKKMETVVGLYSIECVGKLKNRKICVTKGDRNGTTEERGR